ncbi:phosducin-like protein [Hamiltosporidium tvaerminnensis]|uniref:Phosducin-like protein n=2 Tax=Hamiltosporidium TaxID=1176354 RepID=A0A4Q9LJG8_9MICR|nr:hypothetical protein LUQ84_002958 [Hamiltosporidium tvaerminnensis]TBU07210.1 phosducin-like protein [Hamiltosporidium magnivora]TBU03597.1 phosducin-like protein [Hamiltosporidium tvaerminnensis]TBU09038.1 phosducin-like protein [Hamiltosporidium magnivora]TBU10308.1 phosducin-like protein [Hamiltosporidium tvaerminnensis]
MINNKNEEIDSDEIEFIKYKNQRLQQLEKNRIPTLQSEQDLINLTKEETMIVHFFDPKFKRCDQMDKALNLVYLKFPCIQFYRIQASLASFVTKRLQIVALPTLAFFKDGYFVDSVVGFENVGNEKLDLEELNAYIENSPITKDL